MPTIYNKVVLDGTTLMDISDTTATASDVALGKQFYTTDGVKTEGTAISGSNAISVVDTTDSHGGTIRTITAVDISDTTAIASDVASGKYFYTANGTKTLGTASGGSGGTGQTATGTVTGNGTNVLEIPCNFAPDLIYVYGDMSGDVANRGIVSLIIIKDVAIYVSSDSSTSNTDEYATVLLHDIIGYNESDTSIVHATYSNNTLTIDTVQNSSSARWRSGQVYNYELSTIGTGGGSGSPTLVTKEITVNGTYTASNDSADGYSSVTVNVPSSGITPTGSISITTNGTHDVTNYASAVVSVSGGGSTPSATQHVIHLEFSDETNANVNVYYDDTAFSSIITSSKPTTYNTKTVESASLDGVQWYIRETWEVLYENDSTGVNADTPYNYFWISSLSDVYPTVNSVWRITIDSIEYRCTAVTFDNKIIVGNLKYEGGEDDGSGVPFDFYNAGWGAWVGNTELAPVSHVVKIERLVV